MKEKWKYIGCLLPMAVLLPFSLNKYFSIDELMNAHISFSLASGMNLYSEVWAIHHPAVYFLMALPFAIGTSIPATLVQMRVVLLFFTIVAVIASGLMNVRRGPATVFLTICVLISMSPFVIRGTELRADLVAFAFFAVSTLLILRTSTKRTCLIAGLFLGLAVLGSQKVYMYGFPVVVVTGISLFQKFFLNRKSLLQYPIHFIIASLLPLFFLSIYLMYVNGFSAFVEGCYLWAYKHENLYPSGRSWNRRFLRIFVYQHWPQIVVSFVGVCAVLKDFFSNKSNETFLKAYPSLLLLSSWIVVFIAKAPFEYYLIPVCGFIAIVGGDVISRSAKFVFSVEDNRSVTIATVECGVVILGIALVSFQIPNLSKRFQSNDYQLKLISVISRITDESDCFYDQSGSYVFRKHATYRFFTDAMDRQYMTDEDASAIAKDIRANGCIISLMDARGVPVKIRKFFFSKFVRISPDLFVWGQKFGVPNAGKSFESIKDGTYYVYSENAANTEKVKVNGKIITSDTFFLTKGVHHIELKEPDSGEFYVMYMLNDMQKHKPLSNDFKKIPIRFSRIL